MTLSEETKHAIQKEFDNFLKSVNGDQYGNSDKRDC